MGYKRFTKRKELSIMKYYTKLSLEFEELVFSDVEDYDYPRWFEIYHRKWLDKCKREGYAGSRLSLFYHEYRPIQW